MYHFSDDINYDVFFRFDKKWIEDMNWAFIPKASKAVFPVIAAHCNEKGEASLLKIQSQFWPGEAIEPRESG